TSSLGKKYLPYAYHHMKSLEGFVYNDVWQAFVFPEGQQYTKAESFKFKIFSSQYKTSDQFKKAAQDGTWPMPLQKFAWENRWETDRPISRLAWVYFVLYGNKFLSEDD